MSHWCESCQRRIDFIEAEFKANSQRLSTAHETLQAAHDQLRAERDTLEKQGLDLRVLADSYGWAITVDGDVWGLTAGDMGYEPTGIVIDAKDWKFYKEADEMIKQLRSSRETEQRRSYEAGWHDGQHAESMTDIERDEAFKAYQQRHPQKDGR